MTDIYIVVDLETTGLSPKDSSIIQIGAVALLYENCRLTPLDKEFFTEVWPGEEAFEKEGIDRILELNHSSVDQLRRAPETDVVAGIFHEWLKLFDGRLLATAYNIGFDRKFLQEEPWCLDNLVIWDRDLMEWTAKELRSRNWVKLKVALREYGIDVPEGEELHTAITDARMAAKLFMELVN